MAEQADAADSKSVVLDVRVRFPPFALSASGDAVRCTWLISSDCGFDSYGAYYSVIVRDLRGKLN